MVDYSIFMEKESILSVNNGPIGIMGAMEEEISSLMDLIENVQSETIGGRTYYSGKINTKEVVVVFSKWGKVAAAITVTTLIQKFQIQELIFTGVAGAIHPDLKIGDIVLGKRLFQHDMDARPIIPQYELPLLNKIFIETPQLKIVQTKKVIDDLLNQQHLLQVITKEELQQFGIESPKVYLGDIASGDQFISDVNKKHQLRAAFPDLLCVEMEGAAVAQVCYEFNIPFTIIRTISDCADQHAEINFLEFVKEVANKYSKEIVNKLIC
jgi:adenosylhomocysteine nucleosidase